MSECAGENCTHPDCTHGRPDPAASRLERSAPPGWSPEKWASMNRAERRAAKRRRR